MIVPVARERTLMPGAFAALPMYDWPEVSGKWDALWALVHARLERVGIEAQAGLRRINDHEAQWTDPELVIGQTCGWPFVSALKQKVVPFARFDFGLGGRPGDYHSVYITRGDEDPRDLVANDQTAVAINAFNSQSGFRALSELVRSPVRLPSSRFLVTGGHRNSIRAVAAGKAQLAAIDAQSWRFALMHEPAAARVRVAGRSTDVPGLPLITAPAFAASRDDFLAVMRAGIEDLPARLRSDLGLNGIVSAMPDDYAVLTEEPFGRLSVFP